MKSFFPTLLACALTVSALAENVSTNTAAEKNSLTNKSIRSTITLPASAAVISAPFVLTNGILSQPEQTEVTDGGKAVFTFSVTNAGNYLVVGLANAAEESMNSFFLNMDAPPEDPLTIWDLDVTTGFEERTVNWRGNGSADSSEFAPKKFKLSAGEHKLVIVGREPTQLKSISIHPVD